MAFSVAANAYDGFMGIWSTPLAARFADFAGVEAGMQVLDVGAGPGSLTGELVDRLGAADVAAVDPSPSFVAAAAARYPGVDVRQARAEDLPYPTASFDGAMAQLVVHFMTDPVSGLREMSRVVRPGGLVAACVWDFGGGRGPLGPFWEVAHELDPSVVDESELAGARAGHLAELMDAAGLVDVTDVELELARHFESFEAWWAPFTASVGPAGVYAASLDEERLAALRERCRASLPTGPFILTAVAWAAKGRVTPLP